MYGILFESTMTGYTTVYTGQDKKKLLALDEKIVGIFKNLLSLETDDDFYSADEKQAEFLKENELTAYMDGGNALSGRVFDITQLINDTGDYECEIVVSHKWRF